MSGEIVSKMNYKKAVNDINRSIVLVQKTAVTENNSAKSIHDTTNLDRKGSDLGVGVR